MPAITHIIALLCKLFNLVNLVGACQGSDHIEKCKNQTAYNLYMIGFGLHLGICSSHTQNQYMKPADLIFCITFGIHGSQYMLGLNRSI